MNCLSLKDGFYVVCADFRSMAGVCQHRGTVYQGNGMHQVSARRPEAHAKSFYPFRLPGSGGKQKIRPFFVLTISLYLPFLSSARIQPDQFRLLLVFNCS
jgi:hypothetical protein